MPMSNSSCVGVIEYHDDSIVKGWALDKSCPDEPLRVIVKEGGNPIDGFIPSYYRWDLKEKGYGRGYHGFIYRISPEYLDGVRHELRFILEETGQELAGSPVVVNTLHEEKIIPYEAAELTGNKVLVIAPHPDDECFGCGGSLVIHAEKGDPVKVIFLTDGSKADFSGKHRKEDYVELRKAEARRACEILGVSDLEFWRNPDRGIEPEDWNIERLSTLLGNYRPDLIYVPSPFEFHPDHRGAAEIVCRSAKKARADCVIAFCEINTAIRVNTLVDITSAVERKRKACEAYKSQLANVPYTDIALSLNRFRSLTLSSDSAYAEGFFLMKSGELLDNHVEKFLREQFLSVFNRLKHDAPLVSVIMRTKDRPLLLRDALSSIVMQSYPHIEAVVVNDGGEDVTGIVEEFRKYIPVTYIKFDEPRGRSAAGNDGIRAARGKYINFLDDYDLFHVGHVEKLAKYLEATGEKAAYSDCEIASYEWNGSEFILKGEKEPFRGVDYDLDQLHVFNYIPNMTLMFAKVLLEEIGYPDEGLEIYEDWDLWLGIATHTYIQRLPVITAEYREFACRNYDYNEWRFKIYDKYRDYFNTGDYEKWFIKRIDEVYEENRYLRRALAERHAGVRKPASGKSLMKNYYIWRLYSTIRKVMPRKILDFLRRKIIT